jgi:hypothetical protein
VAYWADIQRVGVLVWDDQRATFLQVNPQEPFGVAGFLAPPHTTLFLYPLRFLPIPLAVWVQLLLLGWILVAILHRFASRHVWVAFLAVFASPLMADNALELNIDWLVALGLLVPPVWSAIFLSIKPQLLLTYCLSFDRRTFVRFLIVGLGVLLVSLLIWGDWLSAWLLMQSSKQGNQQHINLAPMHHFGILPSLMVGIGVLAWGWRRRDTVWITLEGVFFVPYIASYSLIVPFMLFATRRPFVALLLSVSVWIVLVILL